MIFGMKQRYFMTMACALLAGAYAHAESYFGYAPLNPPEEETSAQGSGKNAYAEAAITLDPTSNPVVASLKGAKITGVRCFMRADYPQKSKRTSAVNIRIGSQAADVVKNYANFFAGWNDITLDTPVEIGDEPIYIGPMVYETSGNPYPFVSAQGGAMPGGYSISLDKGAWQSLTERGNLMMYLVLDRESSEMPRAAQAVPFNLPYVVAPESDFSCDLTIHNYSAEDIHEAEVTVYDEDGESIYVTKVTFETPLAAYDTRTVSTGLRSGKTENPSVSYDIAVTAIDGVATELSPRSTYRMNVTDDAYLRIPLVEEFTSMQCVNCPFMAYYLDEAIERFGRPYVYITRHVGFADDHFTYPAEKELLYLFGNGGTYNPAIMNDRTVRSESDITPVYKAYTRASSDDYLADLVHSAESPAYARILVDSEVENGEVSCVVRGKIADGIDLEGLYINASYIENGIKAEGRYRQSGIDDAPEDAPADLAEKFRHNGVVRVAFNKNALGDRLEVDPATREFRVDFGKTAVDAGWKTENCETVAFISRVDKQNLKQNQVLNAGGTRWNKAVENGSGVESVDSESDVRVYVDADRCLRIEGEYKSAQVYSMSGMRLSAGSILSPGIYVVRVALGEGRTLTRKLMVR